MAVRPAPTSGNDAPGPGPCALDGDLGWALGVVFRAYVKTFSAAVDDLPGGPRGYQVLAAAAGPPEDTQLALAQQLGVDRTVMTYLLDDLVHAGLVERQPDPADRRARRVVATARGRARLADLRKRLARAESHVLAALDGADRDAFRTLLRRLATEVNARDPVANACDVAEELAGPAGARPRRRRTTAGRR